MEAQGQGQKEEVEDGAPGAAATAGGEAAAGDILKRNDISDT
jgi:hypothetical protein